MTGIHRLARSMKKVDTSKEDSIVEFSGILGVEFNGQKLVDVPNRDGYVYVRLRSNLNEVIQAYNSVVSPVHDLPVVVVRDKLFNRYSVKGRDLGRYEDWGSSSYLPRHGAQHSFSDTHYGGDIVWVYDRQFVPLSIAPSGSNGSANVLINGDVYYSNSEWKYAGNTGSPSLLPYKPTGSNARVVLVYLDTDGNPQLEPGDYMDYTITDVSQILDYLPAVPGSNGTPLGAVRLLSGTSRITWSNIYDLRPLVVSQSDFITPYIVQDEGVTRTRRSFLNFKGQLVWATDNAGDDATDIIISGSSSGHVIQDEGTPLAARTNLNFIGANLWAIDNAGNDATDIIVSGSNVATDPIWDAKGDLAVGTGSNVASRLAVGADGSYLRADSNEVMGMKWDTDIRVAGGLMVGDIAINPADDTIAIAPRTTNPSYSTGSYTLWSRNNSLLAKSPDNIMFNLSGAGHAGFETPNWIRDCYGNWSFYPSVYGATDHGPGQHHLTNNDVGYALKAAPGYMYVADFDGATSSLTRALASPLNVGNWFTFGLWVYPDSFVSNQGIMCMGSDVVSWWVNWIDTGYEFGYYESGSSGTVARTITIANTTTGSWTFVGGALGHAGASYFDMTLQVNDTTLTVSDSTYPLWTTAPPTPEGNLSVGYSTRAALYFNGKMATGFIGGNGSFCMTTYYHNTRGYFNL